MNFCINVRSMFNPINSDVQAGTVTDLCHIPDIETTLLGNLQTPAFICTGPFLSTNFLLRLRIF
jgi:hypothetical protein